jgi:hypothetical protein
MKEGMKKREKTRWNLDKIFESRNSWFMGLDELKEDIQSYLCKSI